MVRSAVLISCAALPVTTLVVGLWRGPVAGLSAAAGSLVVAAFFALGVVGVNTIVSAVPGLAVVGAYVVYMTQLMLLLLVLAVARDVGLLDRSAFAVGAVVGTMVWQVAHTRAFARARTPLYAPTRAPAASTAPKEEQ